MAEPRSVPEKVVSCPQCKGESVYAPRNPYRPFCSERCKNLDLGAWARESFRVPAPEQMGDEGESPPLQ